MSVARETIYALSSGRPPCAVAVVRLSGPEAGPAVLALSGRAKLEPRRAEFARLRDDAGALIDEALVLWFPGPRSETGEDQAELQVHGSEAVLRRLFAWLGARPGLRPAEPGEFTRRALENGRLDLVQAEGLLDLIHATTETQRGQALAQFGGVLAREADGWRLALIEAGATLVAAIDFSDEGDVPDGLLDTALQRLAPVRAAMEAALGSARRGERLREGLRVAVIGAPNAGKSALVNRLAGRSVAIVSPHAGTTRDVIEVGLDIGGYPVVLFDTAGLRDSADPVEQEGVRRALARAAEADLAILVRDASEPEAAGLDSPAPAVLRVANKVDLLDSEAIRARLAPQDIALSALTGQGIDALERAIAGFAAQYFAGGEPALVTRERHRILIEAALAALARCAAQTEPELAAEELRVAADAVGRIAGRVDVEDMLDAVFRDFCIGK